MSRNMEFSKDSSIFILNLDQNSTGPLGAYSWAQKWALTFTCCVPQCPSSSPNVSIKWDNPVKSLTLHLAAMSGTPDTLHLQSKHLINLSFTPIGHRVILLQRSFISQLHLQMLIWTGMAIYAEWLGHLCLCSRGNTSQWTSALIKHKWAATWRVTLLHEPE